MATWSRLRLVLAGILFCFSGLFSQAQQAPFLVKAGRFLFQGKPFQIISGEVHYARIPRPYWADRLRKARAMGLNTVSVYCFWNMHEPAPGHFDFSGNEDVAEFVRLAWKEGLYVILRPGPYVCAEWDFGGYPWWLLRIPRLRVRSRDPRFLAAASGYLDALGRQLAPLQITHGGPILMVQVENEYGSYGKDTAYEEQIRGLIRKAGFDVPLFTADGDWAFPWASLPGVLPGANGETSFRRLKKAVDAWHGGQGPYFIPEYYPGWLDHWGEPFQRVSSSSFLGNVDTLLGAGASINFYMFEGGTNFGFMSGANYDPSHPIQPDLTSYDYDAPLSEAGVPTPKYFALRSVILKHIGDTQGLPSLPPPNPVISLPAIPLTDSADPLRQLPVPVSGLCPLSMEDLGQGSGWVLYRTRIQGRGRLSLVVDSLRDYALVRINGRNRGVLDRRLGTNKLNLELDGSATLDLLVEDLGRINYGAELPDNKKGILGEVLLDGKVLQHWTMYAISMGEPQAYHFSSLPITQAGPRLYRGSFMLKHPGDTFLDLRGWGKGFVWVNGHNLGRYWHIGPQQTLYLPGCWLKKGRNTVLVFEELHRGSRLRGIDHPVLDEREPGD